MIKQDGSRDWRIEWKIGGTHVGLQAISDIPIIPWIGSGSLEKVESLQ